MFVFVIIFRPVKKKRKKNFPSELYKTRMIVNTLSQSMHHWFLYVLVDRNNEGRGEKKKSACLAICSLAQVIPKKKKKSVFHSSVLDQFDRW